MNLPLSSTVVMHRKASRWECCAWKSAGTAICTGIDSVMAFSSAFHSVWCPRQKYFKTCEKWVCHTTDIIAWRLKKKRQGKSTGADPLGSQIKARYHFIWWHRNQLPLPCNYCGWQGILMWVSLCRSEGCTKPHISQYGGVVNMAPVEKV